MAGTFIERLGANLTGAGMDAACSVQSAASGFMDFIFAHENR